MNKQKCGRENFFLVTKLPSDSFDSVEALEDVDDPDEFDDVVPKKRKKATLDNRSRRNVQRRWDWFKMIWFTKWHSGSGSS